MEDNTTLKDLFGALAKSHAEFPPIVKDKTVSVTMKSGGKYTFSYATLGNLIESTKPVLAKNGLSVIQFVGTYGVKTTLVHESGQSISTPTLDLKTKYTEELTPQDIGGLITYAKRYQYAGLLNLDAEEDDDANAASGNYAKPVEKKPTTEPKPTLKKKPKPTTKKAVAEPKPEQDVDKFLESVERKEDLVSWWKEKVKSDPDARATYQERVLKKLSEL